MGVYVPKGVGNFLKSRSFQVHKFLGRKSLEGLFVFCLPESCDMEKRNGKFSAGDVNSKEGRPAGSQDGLPTVQRIWCAKEKFSAKFNGLIFAWASSAKRRLCTLNTWKLCFLSMKGTLYGQFV